MALMRYELVRLAEIICKNDVKTCLMMGVQGILTNIEQIERDFGNFDIIFDHNKLNKLKDNKNITAIDVLRVVGNIQIINSMDYSSYEGADIIFDLNEPVSENKYVECYDLVIDGGTLEHVYNVSNAINNMNSMVSCNGIIYHMLPCAGWVNHGFYSFSPTFFLDTYSKDNNFEIVENKMCFKQPKGQKDRLLFSADCRFMSDMEINQIIAEHMCSGGVLISCTAKKITKSDSQFVPQQGMYKNNLWINKIAQDINYVGVNNLLSHNSTGIYLYGAGNVCKLVMQHMIKNDLLDCVDGVFDSNIELHGHMMYGKTILFPTYKRLERAKTILICSFQYELQIEEILKAKGFNGKVLKLSEI